MRNNTFLLKRNKHLEQSIISWKSVLAKLSIDDNTVDTQEPEEEVQNTPAENMQVFKRPTKQKDGKYHIDNQIYDSLFGSRQDVWDGKAYKTSGGLVKSDLHVNNDGKIVSLCKSISEKANNKLENVNLTKRKQKP